MESVAIMPSRWQRCREGSEGCFFVVVFLVLCMRFFFFYRWPERVYRKKSAKFEKFRRDVGVVGVDWIPSIIPLRIVDKSTCSRVQAFSLSYPSCGSLPLEDLQSQTVLSGRYCSYAN